ncbi:MAG TPA: hypothetical protein G4O04_10905, partial [Anaerolineae bacterium]|nr:hypothetical protein [Anaerolineae bacterium]
MRRIILTVVMGLLWAVGLMGCRGRLPQAAPATPTQPTSTFTPTPTS